MYRSFMEPRIRVLVMLFAFFLLAGCGPSVRTITPIQNEEKVSILSFSDAYARVVNAINTQSYPSNSSGWMIASSDQVGGFVSARLNGENWSIWTGSTPFTAVVTVALVQTSGGTSVNISLSRDRHARSLSERIYEALGITL
jgi:hypothetical protein